MTDLFPKIDTIRLMCKYAFDVNKWERDGKWHCTARQGGGFRAGWNSYPGRSKQLKAILDMLKKIINMEQNRLTEDSILDFMEQRKSI